MSYRRRLHYLTFGGWLVVAILLAVPVLAQQGVKEPAAPVNEGQGVTGEAPTPNKHSGKSANGEQSPTAEPSPQAVSVQDKASTERPCDARCQEAEKREDADLVAQQSMAESTKEIVGVTEWQLYVGAGGIVLLISALVLNVCATKAAIRAAKAAEEAVNVTEISAERQLRAYLSVTPNFHGKSAHTTPPHYSIEIRNKGQTPAYDVQGWTDGVLADHPLADGLPAPDKTLGPKRVLAPDESHEFNGYFGSIVSPTTFSKVIEGGMRFYFWGEITYRDTFDQPRHVRFNFNFGGISARHGGVNISEDGNDAD